MPILVFCWPFLYLYPLVIVVNHSYRAIDNDFEYYYKFKVYLLASLADFHFPLWSPSEAAGYPFASSPFAQAFYPLNLPLVAFYKLAGGYSRLDHQVFAVLAVAIFASGLFAWLRRINPHARAVLFATLVMSVSFKVTEILRFPTAAHAAAWYPWILYALTRIMLHESRKEALGAGLLLIGFVFCQCTAGYPYYVYYDQFLFLPYVLILLLRPIRVRLLGARPLQVRLALATLLVASTVALGLCSIYLLAVKNLLAETTDRAGGSFAFSLGHAAQYRETIGSLVYPPAAQAEGWYFFGITALLLLLLSLFCPPTAADGIEAELTGSQRRLPRFATSPGVLVLLVWWGLINYLTYGAHSHLFRFFWAHWPGFASLRCWARLNIILVPIIAWLLSLAYAAYESLLMSAKAQERQTRWQMWRPAGVVVLCYGVVLCAQFYLYYHRVYDGQWLSSFQHVASHDVLFLLYGIPAFLAVLLPLLLSRKYSLQSSGALTTILLVLLAVSMLEMRHVGSNMWTYPAVGSYAGRVRPQIAKLNEASFRSPRVENRGMLALDPAFNVGLVANWYFKRYTDFLKATQNEPEAQQTLLGMKTGQKIFFSTSLAHSTIAAFLEDASRYPQPGRLLAYTGEELQWEIDAPASGYLSFIDNWYAGWRVFVDDQPAEMRLLFGTFKSVSVPAGRHGVRYSYQPSLWKF